VEPELAQPSTSLGIRSEEGGDPSALSDIYGKLESRKSMRIPWVIGGLGGLDDCIRGEGGGQLRALVSLVEQRIGKRPSTAGGDCAPPTVVRVVSMSVARTEESGSLTHRSTVATSGAMASCGYSPATSVSSRAVPAQWRPVGWPHVRDHSHEHWQLVRVQVNGLCKGHLHPGSDLPG
jgi:hypothetical protein